MSEEKRFPTIDELIALPSVEDARISPDGQYVAYTVLEANWDEDEFIPQVWIVGADAGEPRQLTFHKNGSDTPRWSPDGKWLAFISQRDGDEDTQIYRLSPFGGEAERVATIEGGAQQLAWSPDGKLIAFIAADVKTPARKAREKKYGRYRVEDEDHTYNHLWLLDLSSKKARKLTGGTDFHVVSFSWAPDNEQIAFLGWPSPSVEDSDEGRVYRIDIRSLEVSALTEAGCETAFWSPDGSQIAYTRLGEPKYYANNRLCLIPAGGGPETTLLEAFDEVIMLYDWAPSGLYFGALHKTQGIHLYQVNPEDGSYLRLSPASWFSFDCSVSPATGRVAQAAATKEQIGEAMLYDPVEEDWRCLTNYSAKLADWHLPQPETLRWHASDGTEIEGILWKPPTFSPNAKHPLLVVIHGGPSWADHELRVPGYAKRAYPLFHFLEEGAIVLQPNYRGSSGYGEAFRSLNVRNLGLGDADDVLSGIDKLLAAGYVDQTRIGAMGWSQGGYISAFLTTYSNRFKAISVGAGISNWVTYYVNTDIHPFTRQYLQATPWEEMDIYSRTSPMTYIRQAQTPTLIQHGERDRRVPLPNAYELYQGLQDMDVPVRLVVYQGMGHGPGNSPRFCRHISEDNQTWFQRWIWDTESKQARATTCYVAAPDTDWQAVRSAAMRDATDFRVLTADSGLDSELPSTPATAVELGQVSVLAQAIAEQLRQEAWEELVVYTQSAKEHPQALTYLGCIQVAAGAVGNITVRQEEQDDNGS